MNTLTQLMQYFGYASAFAFVAPAIVLCSIARLGLGKGAPNIVPDIITHGLLLIALGAGLFFQVTLGASDRQRVSHLVIRPRCFAHHQRGAQRRTSRDVPQAVAIALTRSLFLSYTEFSRI